MFRVGSEEYDTHGCTANVCEEDCLEGEGDEAFDKSGRGGKMWTKTNDKDERNGSVDKSRHAHPCDGDDLGWNTDGFGSVGPFESRYPRALRPYSSCHCETACQYEPSMVRVMRTLSHIQVSKWGGERPVFQTISYVQAICTPSSQSTIDRYKPSSVSTFSQTFPQSLKDSPNHLESSTAKETSPRSQDRLSLRQSI